MNILKISLFALLTISLFSCKSDTPAEPVEPLIERNEEVREYIDVLDELVGEYCTLVEKLADKAVDIEEKEENGEEATFLDGLEMLGTMGTSTLKIMKLSEEMEEMEKQQKDFEEKLSAADFEEFMKLYTKSAVRFYDMAKTLEKLEDK